MVHRCYDRQHCLQPLPISFGLARVAWFLFRSCLSWVWHRKRLQTHGRVEPRMWYSESGRPARRMISGSRWSLPSGYGCYRLEKLYQDNFRILPWSIGDAPPHAILSMNQLTALFLPVSPLSASCGADYIPSASNRHTERRLLPYGMEPRRSLGVPYPSDSWAGRAPCVSCGQNAGNCQWYFGYDSRHPRLDKGRLPRMSGWLYVRLTDVFVQQTLASGLVSRHRHHIRAPARRLAVVGWSIPRRCLSLADSCCVASRRQSRWQRPGRSSHLPPSGALCTVCRLHPCRNPQNDSCHRPWCQRFRQTDRLPICRWAPYRDRCLK